MDRMNEHTSKPATDISVPVAAPVRAAEPDPLVFLDIAAEQSALAHAAIETASTRVWLFMTGALTGAEASTMWMEKPMAMARGFEAATVAAMSFQDPMKIARAAFEPASQAATDNALRLRAERDARD